MIKYPIIAMHGLQGSGKTTLINHLIRFLHLEDVNTHVCNFKDTFAPCVHALLSKFEQETGYCISPGTKPYKEAQKAISTWAEVHVQGLVWSDKYRSNVNATNPEALILTDDVRTVFNLASLNQIATDIRPVYLFRLQASEEVRRARCPTYREGNSYTESLLPLETSLKDSPVRWYDIDTGVLGEKEVLESVIQTLFRDSDFFQERVCRQ